MIKKHLPFKNDVSDVKSMLLTPAISRFDFLKFKDSSRKINPKFQENLRVPHFPFLLKMEPTSEVRLSGEKTIKNLTKSKMEKKPLVPEILKKSMSPNAKGNLSQSWVNRCQKHAFDNGIDFDFFFTKFTNLLMIDGKKTKACHILFNMLVALDKKLRNDLVDKNPFLFHLQANGNGSILFQNGKVNQYDHTSTSKSSHHFAKKRENWILQEFSVNSSVFHVIFQALENLRPNLEVRKVRVAGSTYIVPAIVSKKKQQTLALKWIIESAKKKAQSSNFELSRCLADEFLDASKKVGQARQKRDELHRLALLNRAYVRYRWW